MLTDIFSSFDPAMNTLTTSISSHALWALMIISTMILTASFWLSPSSMMWVILTLNNFMLQQLNQTQTRHFMGMNALVSSLFLFLFLTNLLGLLPYVFSLTSHILYTASLGLPLWLSYILSAMSFSAPSTLASLVPQGTPQWLSPFLSLVETISTLSRPLTLSFRLAANMSAGHIVLILLGTYAASSLFTSSTATLLLFSTLAGYLIFEVAICMIQAYIFCLLLSLYANDHPLPN